GDHLGDLTTLSDRNRCGAHRAHTGPDDRDDVGVVCEVLGALHGGVGGRLVVGNVNLDRRPVEEVLLVRTLDGKFRALELLLAAEPGRTGHRVEEPNLDFRRQTARLTTASAAVGVVAAASRDTDRQDSGTGDR